MNRLYLSVILLTAVSGILVSCGPTGRVDISESKACLPHSLSLDSTANAYARIAWNPGCPETRILQGFNVYLSPTSLTGRYPGRDLPTSIRPFNPEAYPGDTIGNPSRETFECKEIDNATLYYAHVRAINSDGTLSPPSNEIEVVAYAQGEIHLKPSYSGEHDGFSFSQDDYCRTDDIENDIYFYHKDGEDYLCSPARLGPVNRSTRIYDGGRAAGPGREEEIIPSGDPDERVLLRESGIYILITDDGHPAKLWVKRIEGAGDDRVIIFEYIYRPPVLGKEVTSL